MQRLISPFWILSKPVLEGFAFGLLELLLEGKNKMVLSVHGVFSSRFADGDMHLQGVVFFFYPLAFLTGLGLKDMR